MRKVEVTGVAGSELWVSDSLYRIGGYQRNLKQGEEGSKGGGIVTETKEVADVDYDLEKEIGDLGDLGNLFDDDEGQNDENLNENEEDVLSDFDENCAVGKINPWDKTKKEEILKKLDLLNKSFDSSKSTEKVPKVESPKSGSVAINHKVPTAIFDGIMATLEGMGFCNTKINLQAISTAKTLEIQDIIDELFKISQEKEQEQLSATISS